ESHLLSFVKDGERYTLKSRSGQLVLTGPPRGGTEDPHIAELAGKMSNEDFNWAWAGNHCVAGSPRNLTPSWKMWHANWKLWEVTATPPTGEELLGPQRIWLRAMEDPGRAAPAHMM